MSKYRKGAFDRAVRNKNPFMAASTVVTFADYVARLRIAIQEDSLDGSTMELLHSGPAIVQKSFDKYHLRRAGIFFTRHDVATRLASRLEGPISQGSVVFDPAMGAGDLLIATAKFLPLSKSLEHTISSWSGQLTGLDQNPDFVEAAKLRLILLARVLHRGGRVSDQTILESFDRMIACDFFSNERPMPAINSCILTNPPYTIVRHTREDAWVPAKASAAALFVETLCRDFPESTEIVGLFPEVLRCGSSYKHYRQRLAEHVNIIHEDSIGRFASFADVDVFLGHYSRRRTTCSASIDLHSAHVRIKDLFTVSVGSVVPHRDGKHGPWRRYITAKTVPAWATGFEPTVSRRWYGTTHKPPFVVIRRTSSPEQHFRAVGSIIAGNDAVAVENHLIVLKPIEPTLENCEQLLHHLKSNYVNGELNRTMRCRHLTVNSIADLEITG